MRTIVLVASLIIRDGLSERPISEHRLIGIVCIIACCVVLDITDFLAK